MKYDFIAIRDYDYADDKGPHVIEAPTGYEPFAVSRWPVPSTGMEFWFIREHIRQRGRKRKTSKSKEV